MVQEGVLHITLQVFTAHSFPGKIKHHTVIVPCMIMPKGIKIWGCVVVVINHFALLVDFALPDL
jgi:hypothetical protein